MRHRRLISSDDIVTIAGAAGRGRIATVVPGGVSVTDVPSCSGTPEIVALPTGRKLRPAALSNLISESCVPDHVTPGRGWVMCWFATNNTTPVVELTRIVRYEGRPFRLPERGRTYPTIPVPLGQNLQACPSTPENGESYRGLSP